MILFSLWMMTFIERSHSIFIFKERETRNIPTDFYIGQSNSCLSPPDISLEAPFMSAFLLMGVKWHCNMID